MSVMVEEAPAWAAALIPSPPVRQTSRSTMDQFKEDSCIFYGVGANPPAPAGILCGSWVHALPDDPDLGAIVGLKTYPYVHGYHSTVSVDRRALALSINKALFTRLRKHMAIAIFQLDTMTTSPELHFRESAADPELKRSLGRLNYLRSLPDGWLGEDSLGASEATGIDADQLLRRIRQDAPSAPLPVLGLDTDGTIVMSWSSGGLTGSMTVYGDGTYSYFVRRDGHVARDAEAAIKGPTAEALRLLLEA
jgi:hypothetical protein